MVFLCISLVAKKIVPKVRGKFLPKKYLVFYTWQKYYSVFIEYKIRILNFSNFTRKL